MERLYDITVEIGGHSRDREKEIVRACMVEWGFQESDFEHVRGNRGRKRMLQAGALSTVSEGEEIEEIVGRIERAVWRSNGGMCHVECRASLVGQVDGQPALIPCRDAESLVA